LDILEIDARSAAKDGGLRIMSAALKAQDDMRVERAAQSLKQLAIERLRGAILSLRFKPGDRLVERELCESMGISRALLREVLSQLEAEGLVRIIPHKGPMVARYSRDEALSIYEVRAVLEQETGRFFAERASSSEKAALRGALETIRKAYRGKDQSAWMVAKSQFYDALMAGARNPMLAEMLRLIHGRVSMLRATTLAEPGRIAVSFKELERIVAAIEAGDATAAGLACRAHVENAAIIAAAALDREALTEPFNQISTAFRDH
jgi:GntR family transcriptional regulator, trigonelline degradation regulator